MSNGDCAELLSKPANHASPEKKEEFSPINNYAGRNSTKETVMAKGMVQQGKNNKIKLTTKEKKQKKKDKADKTVTSKAKTP